MLRCVVILRNFKATNFIRLFKRFPQTSHFIISMLSSSVIKMRGVLVGSKKEEEHIQADDLANLLLCPRQQQCVKENLSRACYYVDVGSTLTMLLPHFGACEGQWLVWHFAEQYRILLHFAHLKFPGLLLQYSQARDLVVTTVGPAPEAGLNRSMVLVPGAVRVNISGFLPLPPVRSIDPSPALETT